jgi:glycosyltransferase involved in cell wall biosynthesis
MAELHEKIAASGRSATHPSTLDRLFQNTGVPARVLYVANGFIPTLQLSFLKPLADLVRSGEITTEVMTQGMMNGRVGNLLHRFKLTRWIDSRLAILCPTIMCRRINNRFAAFRPTAVVFCRYSGPYVECIVELARAASVPIIFHIDDDLLNVPIEIGQKKFEYHNEPARLATVRYLLNNVDLVYCSTDQLKQRLESYGFRAGIYAGKIYCSGEVMSPAAERPVKKIGYMGFDHAHDFEIVLPALVELLRRYSHLEFELFGSIPKPACLNEFGDRVRTIPPVPKYDEFMKKFASLKWDVGLCPLASTPFNAVKANTKWVEYSSVGAAVIATAGTIYDTCCVGNCGILATTPDEWFDALERLVRDPSGRYDLVTAAQKKLTEQYTVHHLRDQILEMFRRASEISRSRL